MRWKILVVGTLVLGGPGTRAQQPVRQPDLEVCRLPGLDEDLLCGRYEVYEDRRAAPARRRRR